MSAIKTIESEQENYGIIKQLGFVNTECFRESAKHFQKYGRYADGDKGTLEYEEYWDLENIRRRDGLTVGGVSITGDHYLYLNYLPIMKIPDKYRTMSETDLKRLKVVKQLDFPDFWDEDYVIFKSWEIAEFGITEEELDRLPIDIPLIRDSDNLSGGHHHLWLKPRGVGASFKGAVRPIRNQHFVKNSKTFIIANTEAYLNDDGIYSKYLSYKNFLNEHCGGFQRNYSIQDAGNMKFRCSYWEVDPETGLNIEKGKKSEVYGIALAGNANKARGKRGDIVWEEFGSNPVVDTAWEQAQSSVEEDGYVYGLMMGFGTGGDDKGGMTPLTKMFYDPKAYNILRFKNKWDEGFGLNECAMFTPAYRSVAHKDKHGNTNEKLGKLYFDKVREEKSNASDATLLPKHQAEKPYCPKEALRRIGSNIFCIAELEEHLKYLEITNIDRNIVKVGKLVDVSKYEVKFELDDKLVPYEHYPVKADYDRYAGVSLLHSPYRISNHVPKNMYRICVDTYRHDSSTGDSVGAVYVIENINRFTPHKGDKIVAWYVGRPNKQDDFNKIVYQLAVLYNAEIGFENDEPGNLVGFAKEMRNKGYQYMNYLAPEFELAYDDKLKGKNTRGFGLRINSGKDDLRKLQGDKYIQEWLLRERPNGTPNYKTIYDRGLLKELIAYATDGNFDRVSAIRVGMYHEREFIYKNYQINNNQQDNFFKVQLFV